MTVPTFRTYDDLPPRSSSTFEPGLLPDSEKERLCRSLLAEFGVTQVQATPKGELIHNCSLPWHDESHPSASLNYKKLTFNCLGCGSSGGLLWYIGSCRGQTTEQARQWLGKETGTGGVVQEIGALLNYLDALAADTGRIDLQPIPKISPSVLDQWAFVHPYLTEVRHIRVENILDFRVGYGMVRLRLGEDDNGSGIFIDSERIVIPHFWRGDLVGWQSRRLDPTDGTGKYVNSPDFPRETTIYNYDPRRAHAVVVESPMSVISKAHMIPVIEATFGASVTPKQMRYLRQHRKVILWMDNDPAGWLATEQVGADLAPYSVVEVVQNPYAADPADFDEETAGTLLADALVPFSLWSRPEAGALLEWKPEAA